MVWTRQLRRIDAPTVAVIGAGFSGLAVAIKLIEAGLDRVTILERAAGPGGVWWHNSYPGAEVDTPSMLYSLSWMPWNWSRTHVRQAELQEYMEAVVERHGLARHIRFDTEVEEVVWNEARQSYSLRSKGVERLRANHVVSAVGLLSDPRLPQWPGIDQFTGAIFHSSQWDHATDLAGKRIAVIGSGSTATQIVPAVSDIAASVTMFQREPGWIVPKLAHEFTPEQHDAMHSRVAQRFMRAKLLIKRERSQLNGAVWRVGTRAHTVAENAARDFIARSLDGRPDLIEAVTPKYMYGGKRPIISDDFYPSLLKPTVRLVTRAVREITPTGLINVAGEAYDFDVIVMATGFKADFITTFDVVGRDGRTVHELWDGDERAFLGIMTTGVPNFFIMYGPNTNGGTIVTSLEAQADYIVAAIRYAARRRASTVEIQPWAMEAYDRVVQQRLAGTSFHYENNYYRSGSGRIATQWPDGVLTYLAATKVLRGPVWRLGWRIGQTAGGRPDQMHPSPFRSYEAVGT